MKLFTLCTIIFVYLTLFIGDSEEIEGNRQIEAIIMKKSETDLKLELMEKNQERIISKVDEILFNVKCDSEKEKLKMGNGDILNKLNDENDNVKKELVKLNEFIRELKGENADIKEQLNNFETLNKMFKVETENRFNNLIEKMESENKNVRNELLEIKKVNEELKVENKKIKSKLVTVKEVTIDKKGQNISAKDCSGLQSNGNNKSGINTIYPYPDLPDQGLEVVCNQDVTGGGWTVFQARSNDVIPAVDFYRNWAEYVRGFGVLSGEFWLGLENIHIMTKGQPMELRIDLQDDKGEQRFAQYESFSIENSQQKYKLNVRTYSGDANDSLSYSNEREFSTYDEDNDKYDGTNCAQRARGAWWYGSCHYSNLNGFRQIGTFSVDDGISWYHFRGHYSSMVKTRMMFRPMKF